MDSKRKDKVRFKGRDLDRRLQKFAEDSIRLAKKLPANPINSPLIQQYIKASTSPGANYQEACEAESAKDFVHKMKIARKELRESRYWLRILYKENRNFSAEITKLGKESTGLIKIISSIISKFTRV